MDEELNKELEDIFANDMSYTFSRNMMMADKTTKAMIETAKRYGLTEKQAVLMLMEFGSIQSNEEE